MNVSQKEGFSSMDQYFIWEKGQKRFFQLPESWHVLSNVVTESENVGKTVGQMVNESIADPIGTLPLKDMIKSTDKVVIVVDDLSRPTPKKEMLTSLIDHLENIGISHNQIDVLFGVGSHRPLSETETEKAVGKGLLEKIRCTNHNCQSAELVSIGRLKTGGEIKVNPLLIEADFRISIGSILPHPFCGFGGGGKSILPGVSGYETIREHHLTHSFARGSLVGNIKNNRFYEEICEAARLANLNFIINAVYNSKGEVNAIISGHFREAHQFGIDLSSRELSVNVHQDADVTIVSAFPHEEGPQVMKPLGTATMVTKKGGAVILVASVRGGIPETFLQTFDIAHQMAKGDPKNLASEYIRDHKLIIEHAQLDFNDALKLTLLCSSRVNVIMVSKDVSSNEAARLGFGHSSSLDEAIKRLHKNVPQATVNIFSAGGLTVPVLKRDFSLLQ
jgi:nickel-dependent lactate racemase